MRTTLSITQLYESPIRVNKTPHCQETTQTIGVPSYITMEMYVLITMYRRFYENPAFYLIFVARTVG